MKGRNQEYLKGLNSVMGDDYQKILITAEVFPPNNTDLLKPLKELGVKNVQINMEVWEDDYRKYFAPMKPSRKQYLKVLEEAVNIFGEFRVSSVIQLLESPAIVAKAVKSLLKIRVFPELIITQLMLGV